MSNPSLIARLGIDDESFKRGMNASSQGLKDLQERAKLTGAQIALLQREMAGGGTGAQAIQLKQLEQNLRGIQSEAKAAVLQLQRLDAVKAAPPPAPAAAGGHGGAQGNRQELIHSTRAVVEMMAAGQSPIQAATVEAPRIVQAFGGGLGPIMMISAVAAVGKAMFEAYKEAKQLRQEVDALGAPMPTGAAASISEIQERLKRTGEAIQHVEDAKSGFWHTFVGAAKSRFKHPFSNNISSAVDDSESEDDENQERAERERKTLTHQLATKQGRDTDLDRQSFEHGEESVAKERIRNKFVQERAEIAERAARSEISSSTELIAQAHRRMELELDIEERRKAASVRAVALEKEIIDIKRQGVDVEEKVAAARLAAAQKALEVGPKDGSEHERNTNAVTAATSDVEAEARARGKALAETHAREGLNADRADGSETEATRAQRALNAAREKRDETIAGSQDRRDADADVQTKSLAVEDAKRVSAEKHAQLAIQREIAQMEDTSATKERTDLARQNVQLKEKLREGSSTYEPSEEKRTNEIPAQIAQNEAKIRESERAEKERGFQRIAMDIDANRKPGTAGQIAAIDSKLKLNADEVAYNRPGEGNRGFTDPDIASRLSAQAKELLRQKKGIQEAEAKTLRDAEATTHEMELQISGDTRAAAAAKARLQYEDKIAAALKDGNTQLAAQLQKQQKLTELSAQIDQALRTPEQRAKDAADTRDRERVANSILHPATRDVAREGSITPDYRNAPYRDHGQAVESPDNAGSDPIGAAPSIPDNPNVPDNAGIGSKSFQERFHPVAPDRTAEIAKSAANAGKPDVPTVDNAGIIAAVNKPAWVDQIFPLKNKA